MKIYTIGFTGKTALDFFEALRGAETRYLLDIRLHNNSQLAGFTKKGHIEYFTERLTELEYVELPVLAPEDEMFKLYREDGDWPSYETKYLTLLAQREVASEVDSALFIDGAVLLCSEPTPEHCHQRLAAEHLRARVFEDAIIEHL